MIRYNGGNHLALATGNMDGTVRFLERPSRNAARGGAGTGRATGKYFFQVSDHDMIAFFEWPGIVPVEGKSTAGRSAVPSHSTMWPSGSKTRTSWEAEGPARCCRASGSPK